MADSQGDEAVVTTAVGRFPADKDLMQLYKKGVRIFDPMKNKFISEDDIINKFGVDASKVIECKGNHWNFRICNCGKRSLHIFY